MSASLCRPRYFYCYSYLKSWFGLSVVSYRIVWDTEPYNACQSNIFRRKIAVVSQPFQWLLFQRIFFLVVIFDPPQNSLFHVTTKSNVSMQKYICYRVFFAPRRYLDDLCFRRFFSLYRPDFVDFRFDKSCDVTIVENLSRILKQPFTTKLTTDVAFELSDSAKNRFFRLLVHCTSISGVFKGMVVF